MESLKENPPKLDKEIRLEGFKKNEWVNKTIKEAEQLEKEEALEFLLPKDIDYRFFISELGKPARDYEFGGIYNPKTRSMILARGYASGDRGGFSNPSARFIPPRPNSDGKTSDDLFFHTHPWEKNSTVGYFNIPQNCCKPSDSDVKNIMAVRQIEENDGFKRNVESIIGSRGYISITEVSGIDLNTDKLLKAGIAEKDIQKIKIKLSLAPELYFKNFAKNEVSATKLISALNDFYTENISSKDIPLSQRIESFRLKVSEYTRKDKDRFGEDGSSKLGKAIFEHIQFPQSLGRVFLEDNLNLTNRQMKLVQEMSGVKISVYKVKEDSGLELVSDNITI